MENFIPELLIYGIFGVGLVGAALIGGALEFGGGILSNKATGDRITDQQNFQERMSNTSYQRGMADMKKAGLNPILAYKTGGATSPSGSMAPVINPFKGAAATGLQAVKLNADLKNIMADTGLKKAQAAHQSQQEKTSKAQWHNLNEDTFLKVSLQNQADAQTAQLGAKRHLTQQDSEQMVHLIEKSRIGAINAKVQALNFAYMTKILRGEVVSAEIREKLYTQYPALRIFKEIFGGGPRNLSTPGRSTPTRRRR